jgi:hypothetical protein
MTGDILREMHPRYQAHMITSRAVVVLMVAQKQAERKRCEFWNNLLYFWKKETNATQLHAGDITEDRT